MESILYKTATINDTDAHAAFLATQRAGICAESIAKTLRNAAMLADRAANGTNTPDDRDKLLAIADYTAHAAANLAEKNRAILVSFVPAERLASSRKFFAFSRKTHAFQIGSTIGTVRKLILAAMLTRIICAEIDDPDFGKRPIDTASSFAANLENIIDVIRLARIDIVNARNKNA